MPSPYQRIADELARRIASGALAPGAKVPSTRALARRYKVATATAARALRELVHAGAIVAVPRSGMIVASRELSADRIVAAAVRIADDEGLDALSIRGVAARLGAPVMSLYRHVRSKAELLELMADAVVRAHPLPSTPPRGWRAQLELAARAEWKEMRRHPWLARVMQIHRPTALPGGLAFADWVMRALAGTRLDAAGKLSVHVLLHSFVQGLAVNVEAEAQARGDTGITDAEHMRAHEAAFAAALASGAFPHFAAMHGELAASFDLEVDALFEFGLRVLLDGLGAL